MFTGAPLTPFPRRINRSSGAGIGRALVTAHLDNDTELLRDITAEFTVEQCISSLWETTVWLTGHTRVHGNDKRIHQIIDHAYQHAGDNDWATEYIDAVDDALRQDHSQHGPGNNRIRRPNTNRPIFHSWIAVQTRPGELGWDTPILIGFDGPRGRFGANVTETEPGLIEGVTVGAAGIAVACADLEKVPVELLLSVCNASTYSRALRGDYDR